jgi:signal transduction histidine kinase/ligand-binding sensor domain-containing protein
LWLCTSEGLARFDGYQFRTYGAEQGLPDPAVNVVLETRSGRLLIGTEAGLAVLKSGADERIHSRFDVYNPGHDPVDLQINALLEDRKGVLWCGTASGLFRGSWTGPVPRFDKVVAAPINDLAEDRAGNLWVAAWSEGLIEVSAAGEIHRYGDKQGLPFFVREGRRFPWLVYSVAVDGEGRIWAGTHVGLCRVRQSPAPDGSIVERVYTTEISKFNFTINCLYVDRSGRLWVGSRGGAGEWTGDPKQSFRHWGAAEGITDRAVSAIGEDVAGNVWIATGDRGAMRVARGGLITYRHADGLAHNREDSAVNAFTETPKGELFAITLLDSLALNLFDGQRFRVIHPAFPPRMRWFGWGRISIGFEDREGDWWLATGEGLCRFDSHGDAVAVARRSPKALYTRKDGLAADEIFRIFEDSRGDIWAATNAPTSVSRWDRAAGSFQKPPVLVDNSLSVTAFAEDRAGSVWIGTTLRIFRWRGGRLEQIGRAPVYVAAVFFDHLGRLWLGGRQGLFRSDDPLRESPEFQKVLGDAVGCIAEDRSGRIYMCTGRGVACLDPANGRLRRFTTADGLGPGQLQAAYRDRRGDMWFGSTLSASRYTPQPETPHPPAPVYITSIRSSGRELPVSERGATTLPRIDLRPYENSLEVDFVGIEMGMGRSLEYEYRLEGAQKHWQPVGKERSVHFASLAPGAYRLVVRAINNEGTPTDPPASVDLLVATPVLRRWWSLSLMAIVLAASLYAAHQRRMRHALELERVRTRIATDLHDDVGASLSRVAIISEVVSRGAEPDRRALADISATCRAVLQSMSEIVWAIDPSHDHLQDLTQRMRWYAGETLSHSGTVLHFSSPEDPPELRLSIEMRRQIYLVFKESMNNLTRHAQSPHCYVTMKVAEGQLVLEIADDGCGFHPEQTAGHGLRNMALRARSLNANFEVQSRPGEGTSVRLRVPLSPSPEWWQRIDSCINMRRGGRSTHLKI